MSQNIVEKLREESVKRLFKTTTFANVWPRWKQVIRSYANTPTPTQILNMADSLREVFYSTNTNEGRTQDSLSGGGTIWESLVCWYLNICNIGRRTVCIKHHKSLIPTPISNAITVNYGNIPSNSESDLIVITFPNKPEYNVDKTQITINDENDLPVILCMREKYNYLKVLNALVRRDFRDIEIHIIQCKTNWNDNAQIPMLWDMIYSASAFRDGISIGREGFNIRNARKFTYSFVTVPTVKIDSIKPTSVCVSRVKSLSGGNYWGCCSRQGVADSLKELLNRHLSTGSDKSHLDSIGENISKLHEGGDYSYFDFPF
ncbi:MAG: hypothetical protein J5791_05800 [Fibrobacter sp.]|nr:hypothetical protein [Fibrobacter sp.]